MSKFKIQDLTPISYLTLILDTGDQLGFDSVNRWSTAA